MMKRGRKELKALAKRALLGNYGTVVGSMLVGYLALFAMMIPMFIIVLVAVAASASAGSPGVGTAVGLVAAVGIWYILVLFASMLFMLGITRICYQFCIGQEGKLGDTLYAFKNHPFRFAGLSMLLMLLILISSIPGIALMIGGQLMVRGAAGLVLYVVGYILTFFLAIAVALRYFMAVFILLEEPWRKVGECIRLSKEMMDGNKMRLFKLQVSFFGILLLTYMTFGIGMLWITPYMICTNIYFYLSVKEEKFGTAPSGYEAGGGAGTNPGQTYPL